MYNLTQEKLRMIWVLLLFLAAFTCSITLGYTIGRDIVRMEAVKAGVAEYYAKGKELKFRFKKLK